jgi:hypothetical protein
MARHEEHRMEHHRPPHMARRRGGEVEEHERPKDQDEEVKEEEKESEERAHGGRVKAKRRHGGKIEGKKPEHRPDRRARGGATSDKDPLTSAGKMSSMPYERVGPKPDGGGKGMDRD